MPVIIPRELPAATQLASENIFVMTPGRALSQDIRPLRIAIVNLMPDKPTTETQLLRLIGNSSLQVESVLVRTALHRSANTAQEHLAAFYKTFDEIKTQKFDGLIVTGAPVEHLSFEEVDYWPEFCEISEWAKHNVFSTLFICWAAQAALYHSYRINKYSLDQKCFGVFAHHALNPRHLLVRGFDDWFMVPHSRHTMLCAEDIARHSSLEIIASSPESGIYMVAGRGGREVYVTGHCEYDADTLANEYRRDLAKGLSISPPKHYFPEDDDTRQPVVNWRSHANLFYSNWLNYFVYQDTPYDIEDIGGED